VSPILFNPAGMSSAEGPKRATQRLAGHLGSVIRADRTRRRWTLRELAGRAGVSPSLVHWVEAGNPASLATYARIGTSLGLRLEASLVDPRRVSGPGRFEDPVHSAIVDLLAGRLRDRGSTVALDEPFQDYHFAGRADLLAWRLDRAALLHVEVKTRFPDIQDALGRYNEKRRYLPRQLAERVGLHGGWMNVTNVLCGLWSAELIHPLRLRWSSFAVTCPDDEEPFEAWLRGDLPEAGATTSSLVLVDPALEVRPIRRWYVGRDRLLVVRPRYHGYADAVDTLRLRGAA
jgi:transcriptional regulator with XRE-family HTH domain